MSQKNRPKLLSSAESLKQPSPKRPAPVHTDHVIVVSLLQRAGFNVLRHTALPNHLGRQYWLIGGGIVTMYDTGRFVMQGTYSEVTKAKVTAALS